MTLERREHLTVPSAVMRPARWLFPIVLIGVVTLLVFTFHGGISANPASRAMTVLGVVERGTLNADPWAKLTSDRAIIDGHTYSDKAPLSSFVVIPFYWLWRFVHGGPYEPGDLGVVVLQGTSSRRPSLSRRSKVLLLVAPAPRRWTAAT